MSEDDTADSSGSGQIVGRRRGYLKWVIAIAIGIPVALEASTFFGLLQGRSDTGAIGVGDDLLPDTTREETVEELAVTDGTFELAVDVNNTGSSPYSVSVATVVLSTDETLEGNASVGPIDVGDRGTLAASWELPSGATPRALEVVAREHVDGEASILVADTVELDV